MEYLIYTVIVPLAIFFRWDLGLNAACREVGLEISDSKQGTGFQDAITPPKRANIAIALWLIIIAVIGYGFYKFGWVTGALSIAEFLVVSVIVGAVLIPKPSSPHYLKIIYRSMVNRYADFKKNSDELRAEAIHDLIQRVEERYSEQIAGLK